MIEVLHGRGRVLARIGKKRNGYSLSIDGSGRDESRHEMSYAPFGDRRGRRRPSEEQGQGTAVGMGVGTRESKQPGGSTTIYG